MKETEAQMRIKFFKMGLILGMDLDPMIRAKMEFRAAVEGKTLIDVAMEECAKYFMRTP